jgi:hypothetical protein
MECLLSYLRRAGWFKCWGGMEGRSRTEGEWGDGVLGKGRRRGGRKRGRTEGVIAVSQERFGAIN